MSSFDLNQWAQKEGWSLAGVAAPEIPEASKKLFSQWLKDYKGPQMNYLSRRKNERLSPKDYFPGLKSILCFGLYYFPGWAKGEVKVSNYAWGRDYHEVLKEKLQKTAEDLKKELGDFEFRICTDTAPVLEKLLATKAGIGWQGKNTLLLNSNFGSYLFLAEIYSSIPMDRFQMTSMQSDHCGSCTRCIDACPTDALEPYVLNAHKCISYWTLEHKGEFTEDTPPLQNWIAGCDICQEVCPWNQKLIPIEKEQNSFQSLKIDDVNSPQWLEQIKDKALNYIPTQNWKRNLKQANK